MKKYLPPQKKKCHLGRLDFDQSFLIHPVSESRVVPWALHTDKRKSLCLILDLLIHSIID